MKTALLALAVAGALAGGGAEAQTAKAPDVAETSYVTADGARNLQQSIDIDAPVAALWKAFSDTAEFRRWSSPVSAIDFRVGGMLEDSYDPKARLGDPDNIKNRIITFIPERLMVFQNVQAPRDLPDAAQFQRTVTVIEYAALAPGRTRVTISSTGWSPDPVADKLYRFFQRDNAEVLETLKKAYEAAPKP
jgi:uncharacterized protein YndB with AHSA1/START domain